MSSDPNKLETLVRRDGATSFRNHYPELRNENSSNFGVQFSKWVDLTEGDYHYFETGITQSSGHSQTYPFWSGYHLSVGLEVKPTNMPADHPNMEKQIQRLGVSQTIDQYDTTVLRVTNADNG
jgi:hypothetical protein